MYNLQFKGIFLLSGELICTLFIQLLLQTKETINNLNN